MATRLMIVESPNKRAKIEYLFADVKVLATVGHICDLPTNPTSGIGIDRATLAGQYALTKDANRSTDGERVVAKIKKFIADNRGIEVFLATDDDREGESIAAFAAKYIGLRGARRMKFNAITKTNLEAAFANAGDIDWAAVASREARRCIDRIIGYTVSPALARIIGQRGVSAGRVQTAVEALIIERERKIRNHKTQAFFSVQCDMGGWSAQWQVPAAAPARSGPKPNSEYDVDDTTPRCFERAAAQRAAGFRALQVASCTESIEDRLPPAPLHTFAMIHLANKILGWDAEKTMQAAQKLFEGGHITYHRTDSPNIDPESAEAIRAWLRAQGLPVPATANRWQNKNKQAQEGHEAIRPAYHEAGEAGDSDEQRALYRLIRERALYSQLAPARYAVKRIVLTEPTRGEHTFAATARALIEAGWTATEAGQSPSLQGDEEEAKEPPAVKLPSLTKGSLINVRTAEITEHTTKAPPRYRITTLTTKLERLSIGRPATIGTIFRGMHGKGLIRKDGTIQPTPLTEQYYDVLYPRFTFAHIGYTAELERALDQVASRQMDGHELTRRVWDRVDADCAALLGQQHGVPATAGAA